MLAVFADFVGLARCALSSPLFIVEASAMLLLEALDIFILRHLDQLLLLDGLKGNGGVVAANVKKCG